MIDLAVSAISAVVIPSFVYLIKRLNNMQHQLNKTMSKEEIEHLIDLKNKPTEVVQRETAQDIKEIKIKLDKLTDRLLNSKE